MVLNQLNLTRSNFRKSKLVSVELGNSTYLVSQSLLRGESRWVCSGNCLGWKRLGSKIKRHFNSVYSRYCIKKVIKTLLPITFLGRSNESYFQVELQILSDSPSTLASTASGNDLHVRELQRELERMRSLFSDVCFRNDDVLFRMEFSDVREETSRER